MRKDLNGGRKDYNIGLKDLKVGRKDTNVRGVGFKCWEEGIKS